MSKLFRRCCIVVAAAAAMGSTPLGVFAAPNDPAVTDAVPAPAAPAQPRTVNRARVGEVVAIDPIRTRPKGSGVGAVAGGVVGGLIGNKVIGGTAATVIGAAGGAVAGNNLERNHREGVAGYHVHVRLDNGTTRIVDQTQVGGLRVGDRVRVEGARIRRL
jgi:outer membrane lipoprotein SlyB